MSDADALIGALDGLSPLGRELVSGLSAAALAVSQRDAALAERDATIRGLEARCAGLEAQLQAARGDADRMRTSPLTIVADG